jgi:hypothetical protein
MVRILFEATLDIGGAVQSSKLGDLPRCELGLATAELVEHLERLADSAARLRLHRPCDTCAV